MRGDGRKGSCDAYDKNVVEISSLSKGRKNMQTKTDTILNRGLMTTNMKYEIIDLRIQSGRVKTHPPAVSVHVTLPAITEF